MIDYSNQAVLVTGGASGIGLAIAKAFRARGARVAIADLSEAGLKEAQRQIGSGAFPIHCDLAKPEEAKRLIGDAVRELGRLDVVCSNAGVGFRKKLMNATFGDDVARLFEINFFAALKLAQAFSAHLSERHGEGRLMITASENSMSVPAAVRGGGMGLYAASKHAVLIASEWLRDELQGQRMSVHVLIPGAVYTPLIARAIPDPTKAPPALKLIMPERCAEIALKGLDLGLFYIPTHAHIADDMTARSEGVTASLKALDLTH